MAVIDTTIADIDIVRRSTTAPTKPRRTMLLERNIIIFIIDKILYFNFFYAPSRIFWEFNLICIELRHWVIWNNETKKIIHNSQKLHLLCPQQWNDYSNSCPWYKIICDKNVGENYKPQKIVENHNASRPTIIFYYLSQFHATKLYPPAAFD